MDTQIIDLRKSYSGYIIPANLSFLFEIIQFEDPGVSQVPAEELYPEEQSTSNFFKVPHLSPLSPPAADPGRWAGHSAQLSQLLAWHFSPQDKEGHRMASLDLIPSPPKPVGAGTSG